MVSMKLPVSPPKTPAQPQPSPLMHAFGTRVQLPNPTLRLHGSNHGCLCVPELVEVDLEPPVSILPVELVAAPGITCMSSSCIIAKDELTGVTYMDMVTTCIGRVTISGPDQEAFPTGPTIEDITDSQ